jgi:predicted nucleotidyltransferase
MMTTAVLSEGRSLDRDAESASRCFMRSIPSTYAVRDVLMFGSRARGDHRQDSDVDLAIVLEGTGGDRTAAVLDMAGIAVDVLMETGLLIQALPLWASEFDRPDVFRNPALVETIKREGHRL